MPASEAKPCELDISVRNSGCVFGLLGPSGALLEYFWQPPDGLHARSEARSVRESFFFSFRYKKKNAAKGNKTICENVRLSAPLLSRFDLAFILVDDPDRKLDAQVTRICCSST